MISNHQGRSEVLERMLHAIQRERRLTRERECRLARRAARGSTKAATCLVRANLTGLVGLARRYANLGLPLEDLIHEGAVGLLEAVRRYDPDRNVRFFTYGAFLARRSMVSAIARSAKTVRVPRHVSSRVRRVRMTRDRLVAQGQAPTTEALAKALGVGLEEAESLAALRPPYELSIDEPLDPDKSMTRGDLLGDVNSLSPEESLTASEDRAELQGALELLPPRERSILEARFGLKGQDPRTLRALGADMSLSKERVRQLEERAKKFLRERLVARFSAPTTAAAPA